MTTTVKLTQMYQIINSEHKNPHDILGMHKVDVQGKRKIAIRAFIPQASSVMVNSLDQVDTCSYMNKIDEAGFFEAIFDQQDYFKYELKACDHLGNQWRFIDPYLYKDIITQYDIYLFNKGNNYKIYEKLGSHVMTIEGVSGVLFGVWAPNAKRVSVIGDFNAWDGRRNPMRLIGNSGVWEIFIPGIIEGDLYKYEIKTMDNTLLQKSDPYGNYAEVRPNNASKIVDISKYQWSDRDWVENRKSSDPLKKPMSIYEVHLGSWSRVASEYNRFLTYRESAHALVDYVKNMGYTHIELMPIEEFPFDGSWGYQVVGYYAPTSRYGTPEDFMYFVDYCHQNNIGVILDWVPAHFPKDAHGLAKFDGTALYEHADPRQGEHPDWGTLIYNFGRNEVKNFLIANALYWIEKYHLDGLRVDAVASMLYLDYGKSYGQWIPNPFGGRENIEAVEFMKHLNSVVQDLNLGVMMIAEESTAWEGVSRPVAENGLGYDLKWNMGWMNDFLKYMSLDPIYRQFHQGELTFSIDYAYTEKFILVLSHDEVVHGKCSMINKMPGDLKQKFANLRLTYGFMFAHPGKKLSFMGNEFGQFSEWSEERSLDWFLLQYDHHKQMQAYYRDLNTLYTNEKAMWEDDDLPSGFTWLDRLDGNKSFIAFSRQNKNEKLIFLLNFIPIAYERTLGVEDEGEYLEIFNSDCEKYGGTGWMNTEVLKTKNVESNGKKTSITLNLPALSMVVLRYLNA